MIRGSIILKDSYNGEKKFGASLIAPEHSETRISTGPGASAIGKQIELKQIYSNSKSTSAGIGHGPGRSIIYIHMSGECQGMNCSCSKIALHFLQHSEDDNGMMSDQHKNDSIKDLGPLNSFVNRHIPFLKENVPVPYMFIVNQGNTVLCLTSFNEEDFQCEPMSNGSYQIRDAFVWLDSVCEVGTELTQAVDSVDRKSDIASHTITPPTLGHMCDSISASLKDKLTYFPLPSSTATTGVTLLQNGCKSMLRITRHEASSSAKAAHPRRAVNSYNFFAMEYRRLVRAQQEDHAETAMTNNQWNKLVGAKWKALSEEQQAPYHRMAEADKRRYNQECIVAGIEAANRKPRPTAYNLFVHQEKQFVRGTNVENVKERTGKHCSLRWQRMSQEEQRVYQLLADSL